MYKKKRKTICKDPIFKQFMKENYPKVIKKCSAELRRLTEADKEERLILLLNRARSYFELGMYKHCIQDCLKAGQIDANWLRIHYLTISSLVARGRKYEAIGVYELWKKHVGLGDLYLQKKVYDVLMKADSLAVFKGPIEDTDTAESTIENTTESTSTTTAENTTENTTTETTTTTTVENTTENTTTETTTTTVENTTENTTTETTTTTTAASTIEINTTETTTTTTAASTIENTTYETTTTTTIIDLDEMD